MSHNPQWDQEFNQSQSMLLWATEGWVKEIQHIGSTVLPGGIAQPVIDMVAGLSDLQGLNAAAELIEGLNYSRQAAGEWCSDELTAFLQKPRVGEPSHTVLLVRHGGEVWQRALAVREHLRHNMADWQRFQNLKRDHLSAGCDAAERYAAAKSVFFQNLEQNF